MDALIKALIGLSAVAFLLAVVGAGVVGGAVLGVLPEALSRASNNTALIAIALAVFKGSSAVK